MLLDFSWLVKKYNINIKGVIQVGCHRGQEHHLYVLHGVKHMAYIEPSKKNFAILEEKFDKTEEVTLYNVACGEVEDEMVAYAENVNQGMSSSLLAPKVHLTQHKEVVFDDAEVWSVVPLDKLGLGNGMYNLMNVDVQGYEDRVFRGAKETLKKIDYIFTEVNREEMYENCALISQLDEILSDFQRVDTGWASPTHGWGDALYIRKTLL